MENNFSVSSPRKFLRRSGRRGFLGPTARARTATREHGPRISEVYGFVGSITTVVVTGLIWAVIFLAWAYVPDPWLHSAGIYYYPNRMWALTIPTFAMLMLVLTLLLYLGLNSLSVVPPTSFHTIFDEFSREPSVSAPLGEGDDLGDLPIEPVSDIGIDRINNLMFNDGTD